MRRMVNAGFGGIGGRGASGGGLSGLKAALGTDERLFGLNGTSASSAGASSGGPAERRTPPVVAGGAASNRAASASALAAAAHVPTGGGEALPPSMRSATPTTATTLGLLKSIPRLGTAHHQRLPMTRAAAAAAASSLPPPVPARGASRSAPAVVVPSDAVAARQQWRAFGGVAAEPIEGPDPMFPVVGAEATGGRVRALQPAISTGKPHSPFGSAHQQIAPSRSFGGVGVVCGELLGSSAGPPKQMRFAPPTGATPMGDWTVAKPGAPKKYVNA